MLFEFMCCLRGIINSLGMEGFLIIDVLESDFLLFGCMLFGNENVFFVLRVFIIELKLGYIIIMILFLWGYYFLEMKRSFIFM